MAHKNKGLIDPEWVVRQRQIVRTEVLETMLIQHGFTKGPATSGSHVKFSHPELTRPVIIVAGTDDLGSQKEAAKKCIEAGEIKAQKRAEARAAKRSAVEGKGAFAAAADSSPTKNTLDNLPHGISGFEYEGIVVLRSRRIAQVGDICMPETDPRALEALCKSIDERAQAKLKELGEINRAFETEFGFDDDTLQLEQSRYELVARIPPYHPEEDHDLDSGLQDFKQLLLGYDYLFQDQIIAGVRHFREGEGMDCRQEETSSGFVLTFEHTHFVTGDPIANALETSRMMRPNPVAFFRWVDQGFESTLGGLSNHRLVSDELQQRFGVVTRRPRVPVSKKPGDTIVMSHPFFPDFYHEYQAPDTIPRAADIAREYQDAGQGYADPELLNRLFGKKQTSKDVETAVEQAIMDCVNRIQVLGDIMDREVMHKLAPLGIMLATKKRPTKPKDYGREVMLDLLHAQSGESVSMRGFFSSLNGRVFLNPQDIDEAKIFFDRIRKAAAQQIDLQGGRQSSRTIFGNRDSVLRDAPDQNLFGDGPNFY